MPEVSLWLPYVHMHTHMCRHLHIQICTDTHTSKNCTLVILIFFFKDVAARLEQAWVKIPALPPSSCVMWYLSSVGNKSMK